MRQTVVNLIEAVRSLRLSVSGRDAERHLTIGVGREDLKDRLIDLHDALDAVDKDGALGADGADERRNREALDAVFRWIRMQGLNTDEPLALVVAALGGDASKKVDSFDIMPSFASKTKRKSKSWKPQLSLPKDRLRSIRSIEAHRKVAASMNQVRAHMGAVDPAQDLPPPRTGR